MANPNLQMFKSDSPTTEVGIVSNPIDFGFCNAGSSTVLSYDILLYNDKSGALSSNLAKELEVELLRMYLTQNETSNGVASQQFTVTYIPVLEDIELEVTVDNIEWRKVDSFTGESGTATIYTFNYTTGVLTFGNNIEGKIPSNGAVISIVYTPDLNTYGKLVYNDQWLEIKSSGVVENKLTVSIEESTKIDNNTIEVLNYPLLTDVIGVWDNISKTGTNYYTGGSFSGSLGRITLGTALTATTPYTEYKYKIADDAEGSFTILGDENTHIFDNPVPSTNAKKIQLQVSVPSTAETEGGAYIKIILRIYYRF